MTVSHPAPRMPLFLFLLSYSSTFFLWIFSLSGISIFYRISRQCSLVPPAPALHHLLCRPELTSSPTPARPSPSCTSLTSTTRRSGFRYERARDLLRSAQRARVVHEGSSSEMGSCGSRSHLKRRRHAVWPSPSTGRSTSRSHSSSSHHSFLCTSFFFLMCLFVAPVRSLFPTPTFAGAQLKLVRD